MPVRTNTVRNRLIGEARKELKKAAGSNQIVSKTEAKKLPRDIAAAVAAVREEKSRVTVDDAVDAYASKVSRVLAAVDKRGKGVLSEAEAKKISDSTLRAKVLDIRAALLAGTIDDIITDPTGGGDSATGVTSAALMAAMRGADANASMWCESGDNGVDSKVFKLEDCRTWDDVWAKVNQSGNTPWANGETNLTHGGPSADVAATVKGFAETAKQHFLDWREDTEADAQSYADAVIANFSGLAAVRSAHGNDAGGEYLVGKTKDGFVAIVVQPYRDG